MLSNVLYLAGAFAMAWLISGTLLMALIFGIKSPIARLLVANGGSLIACELIYLAFDARFFFHRGELIYAAAQLACLASQWLLMAKAEKTPQHSR